MRQGLPTKEPATFMNVSTPEQWHEGPGMVQDLRDLLWSHRDPGRATEMQAYLKGQFPFFGIPTTARRSLLRTFLHGREGIPSGPRLREEAHLLWQEPERELHYCALELLERRLKDLGPEDYPFIESLVTSQSWWDTVDVLAPKLMGGELARNPEQLPAKVAEWLSSDHLWLQRTALLCQLKWKDRTDLPCLTLAIEHTLRSPEFFLRKAIGWAMREYAKTDPDWVRNHVAHTELSSLSRREALKHL